jgi:hypothetical protein
VQVPVVGTGVCSLDVAGKPTSMFYMPCSGGGEWVRAQH